MNKKIPCIFAGDTEMEGFEPSRVVKRLPHFECGPFSHLGTSPKVSDYYIKSFAIYQGRMVEK